MCYTLPIFSQVSNANAEEGSRRPFFRAELALFGQACCAQRPMWNANAHPLPSSPPVLRP